MDREDHVGDDLSKVADGELPADAGSPRHLGQLYAMIGRRLRAFDGETDAAAAMTQTAVEVVPGADFAGMTLVHSGRRLRTVGATDPLVEEVDQIQYQLGSGPCVEAVLHDRPFIAHDLRRDDRWPEFGRRAAARGVVSMMSYRLFLEDARQRNEDVVGSLNVYGRVPEAFDLDHTVPVLSAMTAYAALAVWGGRLVEHAANLKQALDSSRDIGVAQGILMERYKITREEAFGLLTIASQNSNRKLRDIASYLAETGEIPLPPPRSRSRP